MENEVLKQMQSAIPTTKLGVAQMGIKLINALENGEVDALDLLRTFKMVDVLKDQIKEQMRKATVDQTNKYPEKDVELFGCVFKTMEAGTQYDFTKCNDRIMNSILEMEEKLKAEKEKRAKFLKNIDGHITIEEVDEDTGEVKNVKIYPPVKTSTTVVQVKLK